MPFVSIRITRDGVTAEQKAQVIREVTETLERVLHKPPEWPPASEYLSPR